MNHILIQLLQIERTTCKITQTMLIFFTGKVLGHPRLGRPESWSLPLVPTDIALLEQTRNFTLVRDDFIRLSSGYRVLIDTDQSRGRRVSVVQNYVHCLLFLLV